jgi:hypothetical protein
LEAEPPSPVNVTSIPEPSHSISREGGKRCTRRRREVRSG